MTDIVDSLSRISHRYDVLYCDLWGCLHDGKRVFPDAVSALHAFRERGGTVVLLTNSPRPSPAVARQIGSLGAPDTCYDTIASSGDAAQEALLSGRCTGLRDDRTETAEDYRLELMRAKTRGLDLLCANPDVVVDVGSTRIYCAGALAEFYEDLGGKAHYFGKPHPPIYELARRRAENARGEAVPEAAILAIGDGIDTDIRGGIGEGLDTLFITGGLAAAETATRNGHPDPDRTRAFLDAARLSPVAAMGFLR